MVEFGLRALVVGSNAVAVTKGFISTKELKYAEKLWICSYQRKIITSSKFSQLNKSLEYFTISRKFYGRWQVFLMLIMTIT